MVITIKILSVILIISFVSFFFWLKTYGAVDLVSCAKPSCNVVICADSSIEIVGDTGKVYTTNGGKKYEITKQGIIEANLLIK